MPSVAPDDAWLRCAGPKRHAVATGASAKLEHMHATLSSIHIYPLKSCAPLERDAAHVETRGLAHDRRWMVIDAENKFITGREEARLTLIRALPEGHALRLDALHMPPFRVDPPHARPTHLHSPLS